MWKDNITFVLVEPREPGNIGASARALKNMGFRKLALVNPPPVITDDARWLAHNALDILESALSYPTLADAIRESAVVVGTTRRTGRKRGAIFTAHEGARRIADIARGNTVALLFGREDRGLFNDEVDECGFLITIPANREHPSLNLVQAVLIMAYELAKTHDGSRESGAGRRPLSKVSLVRHDELTILFDRIAETLRLLEYIPRGNRDLEHTIMKSIKHFLGRAGLTSWELQMLHGVCSQIMKKLGDRGGR